ncbi:MAG TPA: tetratricopeptide repeat protein [Candidatus Coprovicinus avistercoris]|uniref:Tetratricopeptide repeat protein n=1 Tax=Candidatus Coprovicinus avistercoris TaxID=2840754 RepID=A0A9D1HWP8_9ACTN|nr:tetratricopeptide repeat protein [Candidatus Coprovicinus avistercoris]
MDQQAFDAARAAYQKGDWASVVAYVGQAKRPGEAFGAADHLKGNALMKMGRYEEAAAAYEEALVDTAYGKRGALRCNQGRGLLAAGRLEAAVEALTAATQDPDYATPYKAQMALGDAQTRLGNVREAGIAYRNAAIDENNPDPSSALVCLGGSFMKLGRPVDAVEAYRTALDFSTPLANQNAIWADLGSAYVAANRMTEAVDAFGRATADGSLELTAEQQASFTAAQRAVAALSSHGPSETDALLAQAGYDTAGGTGGIQIDPLDPLGKSGELMPSPEDTGFFSISEGDLVQADKDDRKMRRKHRHTGLKIFLVIFIILLILAGAATALYLNGFGWPTQESVVESLFTSDDPSASLSSSLSDEASSEVLAVLPAGVENVQIDGLDRSMATSTAHVKVTLSNGGEVEYNVDLVRSGISWAVSSVEPVYASQSSNGTTLESSSDDASDTSDSTTSEGTADTDANASNDASSTDTNASSDSSATSSDSSSTDTDNASQNADSEGTVVTG